MKTFTTIGYLINELSPEQRQMAIDKFEVEFYDETVIEDITGFGSMLGINIDRVLYSGFYSQGDGACIEGTFQYNPCWRKQLLERQYTPCDGEQPPTPVMSALESIGERLEAEYKLLPSGFVGTVTHYGRYYHSNCTEFNEESPDTIIKLIREFMDFIYKTIEAEHEYQMSSENIIELAVVHDYYFDEHGNFIE